MPRPRKTDRIDVPAVRQALAAGMTRKAVCRVLGCDRTTLWRALGRAPGEEGDEGEGVLQRNSPVLQHRDGCDALASRLTNGASDPCPPDRSA
jgi:hypothetical protein